MPTSTLISVAEYQARIGLHSNASDRDDSNVGSFQALPDVVASAVVSVSVAVDGTAAEEDTRRRNQETEVERSSDDGDATTRFSIQAVPDVSVSAVLVDGTVVEEDTSNRNRVSGVEISSNITVENHVYVYEASLRDSRSALSNANDGHAYDEVSLGDQGSLSLARQFPGLPELTVTDDRKVGGGVPDGMEETGSASTNEATIAPPTQPTTEVRVPSPAKKRKRQQCSVHECTKHVQQGGLCCSHYKEEHGAQANPCSVDECTKAVRKGGLCGKHFREEHGAQAKPCSVDECTKAAIKGGLCGKHFREEHGAPAKPCSVDECTKVVQKSGMCRKHYREKHGCW